MNKRVVLCAVLAIVGCNKKKSEDTSGNQTPTVVDQKTVEAKKTPEPSGPDPKVVERGAYLAKAGACVVCHTAIGPNGPDLEHPFAGGFEMPDPVIGTWRSPNITQDKSTGIGTWTDDQIARAIREGTRPDGAQLAPIMPYMNYNRLTDSDTVALVAFLRTVKPIARVVAPNKDLKIANMPAPKPANVPDMVDDQLKHGEYMASVMLCNHCHFTPDKAMNPSPAKMFSGGLPMDMPMLGQGHLWGRNITPERDTGIGRWTEEQIYTSIKTMTKPDGKMINGPMLFMQASWSTLDDKDLHAVAAFIKKLPPVWNEVPTSTFKPNPMGPPPGDVRPGDTKATDTKAGDVKASDTKPVDKAVETVEDVKPMLMKK